MCVPSIRMLTRPGRDTPWYPGRGRIGGGAMPDVTETGTLLISMPEIAELAGVQRPVVTNWRCRHGDFPPPADDQAAQPMGRHIDEMLAKVRGLHQVLLDILAGYDWRAVLATRRPTAYRDALFGTVDHLRDASLPANHSQDGRLPLTA